MIASQTLTGRVLLWTPLMNSVTTTSSNDTLKANSAPPNTASRIWGKVILKKVLTGPAPRLLDPSSSERPSATIHSGLEKKRRYWLRPGVVGISSNTMDEPNDIGMTEMTGTMRKASTDPPARARPARARPRPSRRRLTGRIVLGPPH